MENALYHDERVNEVAAVGIPDEKLGELVAAVVVTKPEHHGKVNESELIALARTKYVNPNFIIWLFSCVLQTSKASLFCCSGHGHRANGTTW